MVRTVAETQYVGYTPKARTLPVAVSNGVQADAISDTVKRIENTYTVAFAPSKAALATALVILAPNQIKEAAGLIKDTAVTVGEYVKTQAPLAASFVKDTASLVKDETVSFFSPVRTIETVTTPGLLWGETVKQVERVAPSPASQLLSAGQERAYNAGAYLANGAIAAKDTTVAFFSPVRIPGLLWGEHVLPSPASELLAAGQESAYDAGAYLVDGAVAAKDGVVNAGSYVAGKAYDASAAVVTPPIEFGNYVAKGIYDIGASATEGVTSAVVAATEGVTSAVGSATESVTSAASTVAEAVSSAAASVLSTLATETGYSFFGYAVTVGGALGMFTAAAATGVAAAIIESNYSKKA